MKKIVIVLLVLAVAALPVFAGGGKQQGGAAVKIGVAVPTADHGWTGGIGWWADYKVNELKKENTNIQFNVVHSAN
ncbi:MAG: LacI family transcriptional regulator, partial [Treponema sp.]|nr:LacI family transcriptional regulator [Treponema sp.]